MTDIGKYEKQALSEARRFVQSAGRKSSLFQRSSKQIQTKINQKIPNQVHQLVTDSIRSMIEVSLTSSHYILPVDTTGLVTLEDREEAVKFRLKQYKRTAMIEGAGTGAGGILLGAADFPMLLSIKMKFLFDVGQLYGFEVKKHEERVFLLHVFLLAFSSDRKREEVLHTLVNWQEEKNWSQQVDWRTLQQEYRDTIDLAKLLQLVPGFGALVGAFANGRFLDKLGETAINMYRLRLLT
ncbi:EcsC family protein [Sediminibacillus halophilus]|uniref:EcsC protein family protein n=1 Tax=Sediminibacillus halophilus TaxID=482461 RepID=A0A1G9PNP0_9BACI|nr:EcsC family protein [Sediminibacillus halophilus]SDM00344.1 EcsC protein family protein [Sediminibacillus halophilus]